MFSLVAFVYFLLVSVSPAFEKSSNWLLYHAQFAYRFVTYQNLALLVGIFSLVLLAAKLVPGFFRQDFIKFSLILGLTLSSVALMQKFVHVDSITKPVGQ